MGVISGADYFLIMIRICIFERREKYFWNMREIFLNYERIIFEWWEKLQLQLDGGHIRCSPEVKGGITWVREWRKSKNIFHSHSSGCKVQKLSVCRQNIKLGLTFGNNFIPTPLTGSQALKGFEICWKFYMYITSAFDIHRLISITTLGSIRYLPPTSLIGITLYSLTFIHVHIPWPGYISGFVATLLPPSI